MPRNTTSNGKNHICDIRPQASRQVDFVARCGLLQSHKVNANVSLCLGGNLEKQSE